MAHLFSRLKELVSRGDNLPTLPTIVLQLHRVLEDPDAGAVHVAEVIERDPGLAARLLRTVNSAAFARDARAVMRIETAVTRLGLAQVRTICVVHAIAEAFGPHRGRVDAKAFWAHSATVAALTSNLWVRVGDTRRVSADEAYVVGLLHDVGLLVLDRHFPVEHAQVLAVREATDEPLGQLESQWLGVDHGTVASLMLGRWSLPSYVAEAVGHHNAPHEASEDARPLATVLAAAEAMCWQMDLGLAMEGRPSQPAAVWLRSLGVAPDEVRALIEATSDVHEFASGFLA